MKKPSSVHKWLNTGYELFAKEGLDGIQIERLARILNLNKSSFYHYFGDIEIFLDELFECHKSIVYSMASDFRNARQIDDYFSILLKYKETVLFNMQLVRYRHIESFNKVYHTINAIVDPEVIPLFSALVGLSNNRELASKFYGQVRDMLYSRLTWANMKEEFLRSFLRDVKDVVRELAHQTTS